MNSRAVSKTSLTDAVFLNSRAFHASKPPAGCFQLAGVGWNGHRLRLQTCFWLLGSWVNVGVTV